MRLSLFALVLLAPLAVATPATPPWQFEEAAVDGRGTVGEPIDLIVRVRVNTEMDSLIVLRAPDWVAIEGAPWEARGRAGEVVERAWRLTPTQEGFWAAVAHSDPADFGAACACALGFASGAPESIVATRAEAAVPIALLDRTVTLGSADDGSPRIERTVIPVSSWLAHAEIRVWITPGSTYLCDACGVRAPEPAHEARGPGSDAVIATATLPLQDGDAYTLWDEVIVSFQTPPDATLTPIVNVATGCENRRWGTEESWSCEEASKEWSHMMSPRERLENAVPFAGPSMVGGAFLLACLAMRRASR